MAATALLAGVAWLALVTVLRLALAPEAAGPALVQGLGFLSPLAVVGAFVAGTALWRYWIPDTPDPIRGAVAGGLTALAALVAVAVGFGLLFAGTNVAAVSVPELAGALVDFAMGAVLAFTFGAYLTGWLALPLGLFGGWYHERARRETRVRHDAAADSA